MKKSLAAFALAALCACAMAQSVQPKAQAPGWTFWIEQNGGIQNGPHFRLTKTPFTFYFKGLPDNDYGLAATSNKEELPEDVKLDTIFRIGNGLLVDTPNTKIAISEKGVIGKGWSSWNMWAYHGPAESEYISGFQKSALNADGTQTVGRAIDQLCIDTGSKNICKPVTTPVFNKVFLIVTRVPHLLKGETIQTTRWLEPKSVTIEFE